MGAHHMPQLSRSFMQGSARAIIRCAHSHDVRAPAVALAPRLARAHIGRTRIAITLCSHGCRDRLGRSSVTHTGLSRLWPSTWLCASGRWLCVALRINVERTHTGCHPGYHLVVAADCELVLARALRYDRAAQPSGRPLGAHFALCYELVRMLDSSRWGTLGVRAT